MEYKKLNAESINNELFLDFRRYQKVTKCLRNIDGKIVVTDVSFVDDWNAEAYNILISCLQNTCRTSGIVMGAFFEGRLKGFFSVESKIFGKNKEYLELSCIHVSEDMRGKGIGKKLFRFAKEWAKENGAKKLYISAHSSVETQNFYNSIGCVEAVEYSQYHVEREPYDCQLEFVLS